MAAPRVRPIEYTPVTMPTRRGKARRTTTGIMMLATPMPPRARQLISTKVAVPGMNGRTAKPTVTAARAIQTSRLGNDRATSRGASDPNATKQAAGRAVSRPATTPPIPKPVRISSSNGPTLVTAGRRLNAASTSATRITTPATGVSGTPSCDDGSAGVAGGVLTAAARWRCTR